MLHEISQLGPVVRFYIPLSLDASHPEKGRDLGLTVFFSQGSPHSWGNTRREILDKACRHPPNQPNKYVRSKRLRRGLNSTVASDA